MPTFEIPHINEKGLRLVKHFESFYSHAYRDEAGIWTIGWGHTGLRHNDGTVYPGRIITKTQGEELLAHDMRFFERNVWGFVKVPLTSDQFSALVSFDFNTGGLGVSTLLKKLNNKDYQGAANEFVRWNKVGKTPHRGLTRRRLSEKNLFLSRSPLIVELKDLDQELARA